MINNQSIMLMSYELQSDERGAHSCHNATFGGAINNRSIMLMSYKMTKARCTAVTMPPLADQYQLHKLSIVNSCNLVTV